MRDIIITLMVFGALPYILKRPYWGVVAWIWISVMNPHSQGWGFSRSFPFAAIIAGTTIISLLINKEKFRLPKSPAVYVFVAFGLWMSVTSFFALNPEQVYGQWSRWNKIFLMTLVVMMLTRSRKEIEGMIWAIVISLGFYGVKGGIFTIQTGGNFRVWGPAGTFIEGNNEMALALVMVIPLMFYLRTTISNKWGRHAMLASLLLCAFASLGSYSRGAALAIAAMAFFLWLKSRNKAPLGLLLIIVAPLMLAAMPSAWHERIDTINTYQEDASAMGRINAWHMAYNLASDRPLVGGGFEIYDEHVFALYAPDPLAIHAAHSIYFQMLGEHGWPGLILYLTLAIITLFNGQWIIRNAKQHKEMQWAIQMATMLQVSLLGFATGGAFLSLAYFDVPYFVMAAMVATRVLIARELAEKARIAAEAAQQIKAERAAELAALVAAQGPRPPPPPRTISS